MEFQPDSKHSIIYFLMLLKCFELIFFFGGGSLIFYYGLLDQTPMSIVWKLVFMLIVVFMRAVISLRTKRCFANVNQICPTHFY